MKKLIVIAAVSMLFLQQAAAYTWNIRNNNPTGRVRVTLDAAARPDYQADINPGATWSLNTGIYCVQGITVSGVDVPYSGQTVTHQSPGTACRGYKVEIGHKRNVVTNQFTGITTQQPQLDAALFY